MITKPDTGEIVSKDILDLLPHRYPFLLVDRVLAFESMKSVHAVKSVSINEPFFSRTLSLLPGHARSTHPGSAGASRWNHGH